MPKIPSTKPRNCAERGKKVRRTLMAELGGFDFVAWDAVVGPFVF